MRCQRGAVPRLKSSITHPQAIHYARGLHIVGVAYSEELLACEVFEGERSHSNGSLSCQALVPEVRMEAPSNFKWVCAQGLQVSGKDGFPPQVLDAACPGDSTTAQVDECPPTCSPRCPAAPHPRYCFNSLLAGLGLSAYVPHDLWPAVHVMKPVQVPLRKGLEAQSQGMQDGQGCSG